MSLKLKCPNAACGQVLNLPDTMAGHSVTCPKCAQQIQIGRFQIRALLGAGAFGAVYRAFDPQLEREVALKVPKAETLGDADAAARFLREAKAAAKLHHSHIVPVFDAGQEGDKYFIVSAFIAGKSLSSIIPPGGLKVEEAVRLTIELAEALAYAHKNGVLHRDVKPANALVDEGGSLFLTDFGLARWLDKEGSRLTNTGAVMGTPAYMSPEQAAGDTRNIGPGADQYSAGVTLYHLLTGRLPFDGPAYAVITKILQQIPPPPSHFKPGLDPKLEAICLKAMAREPGQRYLDCQSFAAALKEWLGRHPPGVHAASQSAAVGLRPSGPRPAPKAAAALASAQPVSPTQLAPTLPRPSRQPAAARDTTSSLASDPTRTPASKVVARSAPAAQGRAIKIVSLVLVALVLVGCGIAAGLWLNANPSNAGRASTAATAGVAPQAASELDLGGGLKLSLAAIEAGSFWMGSTEFEEGRYEEEGPQHQVSLTRPFYVARCPVTVGQFRRFVTEEQYRTDAEREDSPATWKVPGFEQTDDHPVVHVSWNDAKAFCAWLTRKNGRRVRLPSEAEWEYACRAGASTRYHFGNDETQLRDYAWFARLPGEEYTHPVGKKKPNALGLYDMHGNVWQWCEDVWRPYSNAAALDPIGDESAVGPGPKERVVRGGSYDRPARDCRCAVRDKYAASDRRGIVGFRVLADLKQN